MEEIISKLNGGISLDWTDIRIYLIFILASFIGGFIGAYSNKYFGKRGEIDAIKKDLQDITKIQEEIKSKVSTNAFIDQKWWDLKRETYWDITKALNNLSDAYFNLITDCFDQDKQAISDPIRIQPYINKLSLAVNEYLNLTGVSFIVMSRQGKNVITELAQNQKLQTDDLKRKALSYDELVEIRNAINIAYNKIIEVAKADLNDVNV